MKTGMAIAIGLGLLFVGLYPFGTWRQVQMMTHPQSHPILPTMNPHKGYVMMPTVKKVDYVPPQLIPKTGYIKMPLYV
jgi:hypothetical protein